MDPNIKKDIENIEEIVHNITYEEYDKTFSNLSEKQASRYMAHQARYSPGLFSTLERVIEEKHPKFLNILNRIRLFK